MINSNILEFIRTELKLKYKLWPKPRERFIVIANDIEHLLRGILSATIATITDIKGHVSRLEALSRYC